MECVACTACIDACDDIMDRLHRPRGLIRYDSPDGLAGRPRRIVRLRVVLYTALLVVGAVVALLATRRRTDFEVTLLRLPGAPYTVDAGQVRDALQLHIVNKRASADTFHIEVEPVEGMTAVIPMTNVSIPALSDVRVPVFLSLPRERFRGDFALRVHVARSGGEAHGALVSATFLGPSS